MCEYETHTHTYILEETSTFPHLPISRNLILSSREHYITVIHGCRMSTELNPLAISSLPSSLFLAGHLMGTESFVYFTFL